MTSLAERVAARMLAPQRVAARFILSDDRFRPPKQIANGVDSGELPVQCLAIWKYTVERLGDKFNFGAGTAYWRNKCLKEGINLPAAYLKGGEGASFGPFKIKTGDEIEVWVKERLRSENLWQEGVKSANDWQLEISHLESALADAQKRIATHEKGIEEGTRVNQRIKWLAEAKSDLAKAEKGLDEARKALDAFKTEVVRHEEVVAPVIDFEKQFQTLMQSATMDLSKREVLAQAKAALAKFEQEMANQAKTAGVFDTLWGGIEKAWDWVSSAFHRIVDWAADLMSDTKRIGKLLDSVS